jgi:hypothetical protein
MIPGTNTARNALYIRGLNRAAVFCEENDLKLPEVRRQEKGKWPFSACAYYRPTYIAICVEKCAPPGHGGRQWSWPGYVVDRTPYGVIQHELGHHADVTLSGMRSGYQGTYSKLLRAKTCEEPITTYTPNDAEWFAEIFRLFVTNAALLKKLRPLTYVELTKRFEPISAKDWREELGDAQDRYFKAAERKIEAVS